MAQLFNIHPQTPHLRLIRQTADIVRKGGIIVYPTDSCYALGCQIGNKEAMDRIRTIRKVDQNHNFTLVCRDLAEIATYAKVDNAQYRLLKAATPGSYTFILTASREVPRLPQHPLPQFLNQPGLFSKADEDIRIDDTQLWMVPTNQDLKAIQPALAVHLRLKLDQ